tara:strand:- start:4246 stop:4683 length:438 start_codon:yes stop_codon:yes gene_type:complete
MKAKTFENLIRKVVREEIDYALRREIKSLKEDLRTELKPTITEHTEKMVEVPQQNSLKEKIMGKNPSFKSKSFTNNSTLNDLLNETAMGDTNLEGGNSSPVSLSQPFASEAPMSMDTAGMPDSVAKVVTRDYSSLMKAIDKKKGK